MLSRNKKDTLRHSIHVKVDDETQSFEYCLLPTRIQILLYLFILCIDDSCGKTQWLYGKTYWLYGKTYWQIGNRPIYFQIYIWFQQYLFIWLLFRYSSLITKLLLIEWICIPSFFLISTQWILYFYLSSHLWHYANKENHLFYSNVEWSDWWIDGLIDW